MSGEILWAMARTHERIADALESLAKRRPNPQVIVLPVANGPLTKENLERASDELRRVFERAMGGETDA
jgi:hypothetical protein